MAVGMETAAKVEAGPEKGGAPDLYRLTVGQYEEIARVGIIPSGAKVELLDGLLVDKMTKNPPHTWTFLMMTQWLVRVMPDGWTVSPESPLVLKEQGSVPEPDFAILRGGMQVFDGRNPTSADAALVIEISDTSYRTDREIKGKLYAAGGVPEYWIVNLNRRVLEVFTSPTAEGFGAMSEVAEGGEVVLRIDGREVARKPLAELLPRSETR